MSRSLRDLSSHLSSGQTLTGVAFNSMRVEPGHAFFALPGAATHGIHYADEALSQGALLVISDRPHPQGVLVSDPAALLIEFGSSARNSWSAPVIGITGSVGKTTTKDLLAAALLCPSSPGNRNTTLALAAEMINLAEAGKSTEPLVLELGIDQIGEMAALIELVRPSHGLVTSIAESHLDGLGDLATVAREKAKLLEAATHSYADIAAVDHLRPELRTRVTTYGLKGEGADEEADLSAEPAGAPVLKVAGTTFRLPGVGRSVARNAAGALALATDLGVAPELAASRMTHVAPAAGRLQLHAIKGTTLIDDSYNSNPTSLAAAFEVLLASPRPQTAILGDMLELGDRADELHLAFSPLAMQVDRLVTVGKRAGLIAPEHGEALRLADAPEVVASLGQLRLEGTLLVKGSRGMRLDLVTEALLRSGGCS